MKVPEAVVIPHGWRDTRISIITFGGRRVKFVQKAISYYHCCRSWYMRLPFQSQYSHSTHRAEKWFDRFLQTSERKRQPDMRSSVPYPEVLLLLFLPWWAFLCLLYMWPLPVEGNCQPNAGKEWYYLMSVFEQLCWHCAQGCKKCVCYCLTAVWLSQSM